MKFGPGPIATFFYYFVGTTLLSTVVLSKSRGLDLEAGLQSGLLAGFITALVGAYLNQTTTFSVSFQNQQEFLTQAENVLTPMGYHFISEEDGARVYERSQFGGWLFGKIYLQLDQNSATFASRAVMVRRLQQRLG